MSALQEGTFRAGSIFGINILIHWTWLIIFGLLAFSLSEGLFAEEYADWTTAQAWIAGSITTLTFFGSILLHELSHSVVARRSGLEVSSITLFIFGGASALTDEPREPSDEALIAGVGPLTSFALAGLFAAGALVFTGGIGTALLYLTIINIAVGAFNLLPGFPLDGGRVLRSIVWARTKNLLEATRIASLAGSGVAIILMGLGVIGFLFGGLLGGIWFVIIGWFLLTQSRAAYEQLRTKSLLEGLTVEDVMSGDYHRVRPDLPLDSFLSDYVLKHHARAYPALTDETLVGLISITDLQEVPREEWQQRTVEDVMTPVHELETVEPSDDLGKVAQTMGSRDIHQLPVLSGGRLLGLVTRSDLIRLLQTRGQFGALEGQPS